MTSEASIPVDELDRQDTADASEFPDMDGSLPTEYLCLRNTLPKIIHRQLQELTYDQRQVLEHFGLVQADFTLGRVALLYCDESCNSCCLVANVVGRVELANLETLDNFIVPCPHDEETRTEFAHKRSATLRT